MGWFEYLTVGGTAIGAIGSAVAAGVLVRQLGAMRSQLTVSAILDVHDKVFFGGRDRHNAEIIRRIEHNAQHPKDRRSLIDEGVDDLDLDDYLGTLELVALLFKKHALDWDYAYHMFGHYVAAAWDDPDVRAYVGELRRGQGPAEAPYYGKLEEFTGRVGKRDEGGK